MRRRVEEFIQKQGLLQPGDRVLAAVSGGADSVCLLHVLVRMREEWNLKVRAFHVNHGLRGAEADRDAAFTEELCRQLSVPCRCRKVDVRGLAEDGGLSEEEAARNLRYQALEEAAEQWEQETAGEMAGGTTGETAGRREYKNDSNRPVWIAVAHHSDDNVETILHNLFRGSGLKGLSGIQPVRGRVIRPLLAVTREEILNYLEEEGISYCVDSTNQSEEHTRNKLRLKIMPLIAEEINERAPEHILQAAERAHQADEYLEGQAALWLRQYGVREAENGTDESGQDLMWAQWGRQAGRKDGEADVIAIPARSGADAGRLASEPAIIQTYVIRQMIGDLTGSRKDLTSIHVESVRELLAKQAGKQVDLPYGLMARRTYDYLWIERSALKAAAGRDGRKQEEKISSTVPGAVRQGIVPPQVEFKTFSCQKGIKIPENQYTKWFDYDKIKGTLSVRTRQTGDYFILPGGGRKTIKTYLIDEKIPFHLRDQVFLLADGSHILWVIGRRISEGCKVTEQTKTILQVHISGGNENG